MEQVVAVRLIGRVLSVKCKPGKTDPTYGFIVTDDKKQYFFHFDDMVDGVMPSPRSIVEFDPIEQTAQNKNDRAANVVVKSVGRDVAFCPGVRK